MTMKEESKCARCLMSAFYVTEFARLALLGIKKMQAQQKIMQTTGG
jgi:hypothetical protein